MNDGGKGSARRPGQGFGDGYDRIWRKRQIALDAKAENARELGLSYDDDEPGFCTACNGSGEGMYDGSRCFKCKGRGVEPIEQDNQP